MTPRPITERVRAFVTVRSECARKGRVTERAHTLYRQLSRDAFQDAVRQGLRRFLTINRRGALS